VNSYREALARIEERPPRVVAAARPWLAANGLKLAMVLVAAYVYVLREPTFITASQFLGEDATIFFVGAVQHGVGAFLEPYNGQLFLYQRLVAFVAAPLPYTIQPAIYAVFGAAAAVFSCSIALSSRWRMSVPLNARFACMVALLCSVAVTDAFVSLVNAHWWLGVGLILLGMLGDPVSRRLKAGEVAFTAVAALSGFAAIYAAPSLAVRAIRNRSRHSLVLLGVALAGGLVQIVCLIISARPLSGGFLQDPKTALLVLVKRVLAQPILGSANLADVWQYNLPNRWVWLLVVALGLALVVAWIRAPRLEAAALVLTIIGGWILALGAVPMPGWEMSLFDRYYLLPIAAVYVSLILSWPAGPVGKAALGLACVLLATGLLSSYHLPPMAPSEWPSFAACLKSDAHVCTETVAPGWEFQMAPPGH
jgi:hypothetical protein